MNIKQFEKKILKLKKYVEQDENEDLSKYGIKSLTGGTLEDLKEKYSWILEAEIEDAELEFDFFDLNWKKGTWYEGTWYDGTWYEGTWYEGTWKNGYWKGGDWKKGTWKKGTWNNGTWNDGDWNDGDWKGGVWENGVWKNGYWKNGYWKNGYWKGGDWYDGTWYDGTWNDGTWYDGTWNEGTWKGGVWENGVWENGVWYKGTWQKGDWKGGKINGKYSINAPIIFKKEKIKILKSDEYKSKFPQIYKIKDVNLQFIADFLSKQDEIKNIKEKVPIKQIKKYVNLDNNFGVALSRKSGKELIQNNSSGFSIQDIINFDKNYELKEYEGSLFDLKLGKELTFDMSKWDKNIQVIFDKPNQVFQINLKKEYFQEYFNEDEIIKINAYIIGSNHPTSKKDLTLSWCRYTVFKDEKYVVLDEFQTDMLNSQLGLSKDKIQLLMNKWEQVTLRYFIKFIRSNLGIRKIYAPNYNAKLDLYNAKPPQYLYKDIIPSVGFKKTKSDELIDDKYNISEYFYVLENKKSLSIDKLLKEINKYLK